MLKKHLGQHLLVSKGVLEKIADQLEIEKEDKVVEIGGGTGNLTREILKRGPSKVWVLEVDKDMIRELLKIEDPRLEVLEADASEFDFCSLGEGLKVVGNLPYNVASLILERIVFSHRCVRRAVLMFQKEVAEKIIKGDSWLGAFVQFFFEVKYLMSVPARFFIPPPKVVSGLIRLESKGTQNIDPYALKRFLVRIFSQRKKKIGKKLPESIIRRAGLSPDLRVHEIDLEGLRKLFLVSYRVDDDRGDNNVGQS